MVITIKRKYNDLLIMTNIIYMHCISMEEENI